MTATSTKPWVEVVSLHPDVVSEDFSEDIFALDLGLLAEANRKVPAVYRDPENFSRASYITNGLRSLLGDTLSRLTGGAGNRAPKLITPSGGGKSHTLAALYHAGRDRKALDHQEPLFRSWRRRTVHQRRPFLPYRDWEAHVLPELTGFPG